MRSVNQVENQVKNQFENQVDNQVDNQEPSGRGSPIENQVQLRTCILSELFNIDFELLVVKINF